jgi:hypothetical protein
MNMQKAVMMVTARSQDANSRINVKSTKVQHVAKIMHLESAVYPEGMTTGRAVQEYKTVVNNPQSIF